MNGHNHHHTLSAHHGSIRPSRTRSTSCSNDWPEDHPGSGHHHFHPEHIETHDVLIVGNGPSAITLSFLLSGRWPYYDGQHPIDFLHQRLTFLGPEKSLLEVDLDQLSQGLSGRSLNRVSVLFDQLQNPNTDFGNRQPSTLHWKYHPEKAIDHLVLGTGLPGGLWYNLRKSKTILTVSRQKWMQLPEMPIPQEVTASSDQNSARISFDSIANYYRSYVDNFNLSKHFRNHTRVIRVTWCSGLNCWIIDALTKRCVPKHTTCPLATNSNSNHPLLKHFRCISKLRCSAKEVKVVKTRFLAKSVVLATGANSCTPSMLNVPGEVAPFVLHSLDQLDSILKSTKIPRFTGHTRPSTPILLLIGSGLSSADALLMLTSSSPFRVIHIFRRSISDRTLIFNSLSNENLYPEYTRIFSRMKTSVKSPACIRCFLTSGAPYQAYHRTVLRSIAARSASLDFLESSTCTICSQDLADQEEEAANTFPVSLVLVLIGSKPALDFLPAHLVAKLGRQPNAPIDIRQNPVQINTVTHEALAAKNLYAVGPLVGDNFVRFVQGGAFAVAADLNQKKSRADNTTANGCDLI